MGGRTTINTTGFFNVAIGFQALLHNVDGAGNTAIGYDALYSNTSGVNNTVGVIVDSTGHLGTTTSSERYKENIQPMDKASEAILSLQPVTFRYKHTLDPAGIPQFGLVAEQVEQVNPDLVARDEQGKPYSVRYEAVNAMLLNEFLKEHRKVEEQTAHFQTQDGKIADLKGIVVKLQAALEKQAAQLQKISARIGTNQPATRVASE